MTVSYIGAGLYLGLDADIKPTAPITDAIFIETDTGEVHRWNGSSWAVVVGPTKTETYTNKTYSDPILTYGSATGTVTLPSTSGNFLEFVKQHTDSSAEMLVKWRLDEATTSYVSIENAGTTNAQFLPSMWFKQLTTASGAAGFFIGQIHSSFDSGSVPAFVIDGRTNSGALGTRPILGIRNQGTDKYVFGISSADWKNNSLVNAGIDFVSNTVKNSGPATFVVFKDTDNNVKHINTKTGAIYNPGDTSGATVINNAISAAFTTYSGGIVQLKAGAYTGDITLNHKVLLRGEGFSTKITGTITGSQLVDIVVEDIWLAQTTDTNTLYLSGCKIATFERCKISGDSTNTPTVKIDGGTDHGSLAKFDKCTFTSKDDCIYLTGSGTSKYANSTNVTNCYIQFSGAGKAGEIGIKIDALSSRNAFISNNYFEGYDIAIQTDCGMIEARKNWFDNSTTGYNVLASAVYDGGLVLEGGHAGNTTNLAIVNGIVYLGGTTNYRWKYDSVRADVFPSTKKTGIWQGASGSANTGEGLLLLLGTAGTATSTTDSDGKCVQFATGAVSATIAGMRSGTATSRRDYNPRLRCKFKLTQLTDTRLWIGWGSSAAPNGDSTLDTINGVLFGISVANNTTGAGSTVGWQIISNNAAGTQTTLNTGLAADTNAHTIDIQAIDASGKFACSLDNATPTNITTTVPASTQQLFPIMQIQNSSANDKQARFYYLEIEQDK